MTTTFPTSIDIINNPSSTTNLADSGYEHDIQHDFANDAIKAIEAKIGIDGTPISSSLDYVIHHHAHTGSDGSVPVGSTSLTSISVIAATSSSVPITGKATVSQTADIIQTQDSSGVPMAGITGGGLLYSSYGLLINRNISGISLLYVNNSVNEVGLRNSSVLRGYIGEGITEQCALDASNGSLKLGGATGQPLIKLNAYRTARVTYAQAEGKNNTGLGGISWQDITNADSPSYPGLARTSIGVLQKTSDGSQGVLEQFMTVGFPTYDGVTTATKSVAISVVPSATPTMVAGKVNITGKLDISDILTLAVPPVLPSAAYSPSSSTSGSDPRLARYDHSHLGLTDGYQIIPPKSLVRWAAKLAAAITGGLATIACFSDSVGQGFSTATPWTQGWVGLLANAMHSYVGGTGGSGFLSVVSTPACNFSGQPNMISQTGTWLGAQQISNVPNGCYVVTTGSISNGSHSLTWPSTVLSGRYIDIWYGLAGSGATLSFKYSVDGGSFTTFSVPSYGGSGPTYSLLTIDTGVVGAHSIVIETAASNNGCLLYGVTGRNNAGVLVHNLGLYGRSMSSGSACIAASMVTAPDLIIVSLGINDAASGVVFSSFRVQLQACLDVAAAYNADILVLIENQGVHNDGRFTSLEKIQLAVAQAYGAVTEDLWAKGGRDPNYMVTNGYSNSGDLHPNATGHVWIESDLVDILIPGNS